MSVIVKKVFPPKGQAPGDVTIISKIAYGTKAYIKWSDPANTVSNGVTVATWGGTLLLRKTGSYPTSITDGTVVVNNTTRDKYKSTDFVDSGLTNGTTYYYRFFTYDNGILRSYNTNTSMQFTLTCYNASTTLANNSWETISAISEAGVASSLWNIGDEITFNLSKSKLGHFNAQTYTLQIWDFNHFDKVDGSGKAGIVFGMKYLNNETLKINNTIWNTTEDRAWTTTTMGGRFVPDAYTGFPDDLKAVMKEVYISSNSGAYHTETSTSRLFLPSASEIDDYYRDKNYDGDHGVGQFPIFTDAASRKKYLEARKSMAYSWWTRSHSAHYPVNRYCIVAEGSSGWGIVYSYTDNVGRIAMCFCV